MYLTFSYNDVELGTGKILQVQVIYFKLFATTASGNVLSYCVSHCYVAQQWCGIMVFGIQTPVYAP